MKTLYEDIIINMKIIFQDGVAAVSVVNFAFHEKRLYSSNNIMQ